MLVTPLGMVMLISCLQPSKALYPMLVTLFGMVNAPVFPRGYITNVVLALLYTTPLSEEKTVLAESTFIAVRLVQPIKASSAMLVTPLPMATLARLVHWAKAQPSMLVTLSGMVKEALNFPSGYLINVVLVLLYNTPSCELYAVLPESTFIAVRLVQSTKALSSMLATLLGMVMLARPVQFEKALYPMLATLLGIVALCYALVPSNTTYCSNSIPDKELCQHLLCTIVLYYYLLLSKIDVIFDNIFYAFITIAHNVHIKSAFFHAYRQ